MLNFIIRRILLMILTLLVVSIISFIIIQAPPGDFLSFYLDQQRLSTVGTTVNDPAVIEFLRVHWGLNQPIYMQYLKWLWNLFHGNLGNSFAQNKAVTEIIAARLPASATISLASLIFVYAVSIPIGVFSATHKYSIGDYLFTFIGFIGVSVPSFLIALVTLWLIFIRTGSVTIGLFSAQFQMAPWSLARLLDLGKHIWVPVLILGLGGTCGLIRVIRNNLLDELSKPYVVTCRAKGLPERKLLYKYPFRIAINPVISTIGWTLPGLITGELLVSLVLNIPTLAPVFVGALLAQDMFLASSIVLVLSFFTILGTLISDLLLAWLDPRIRYE